MFKGLKVVVTGAGGFIGSHLVEKLVGEGAKVKAFIRYNSRSDIGLLSKIDKNVLKKVEIIFGDLKDADATRIMIAGSNIVFHLGALIAIPYSYIHPREVVETNVLGTLNILEACRKNRVDRLIHTSTSEVYGSAQKVPIDEEHQLRGQSPYSASKIAADKLAESFFFSFNLPVATIRPFNAYGPRQSARAVIPTIITQLLKNDYIRLGNLAPTRDFTYVSDTVDGFIKISSCDRAIGKVINIGSGSEISILDLVTKIAKILGKEIKFKSDKKRFRPKESEVTRLIAKNQLAQELISWKPKVSLDEGLTYTIAWITSNMNFYDIGKYQV